VQTKFLANIDNLIFFARIRAKKGRFLKKDKVVVK